MASVLDSINRIPAVEIKPGHFILIRGRPCKVKKVHHVIFSIPVCAKYGHRTIEIGAVDMLTKIDCSWLGYGHTELIIFFPVSEKLLFISLLKQHVLGLNTQNKLMRISLHSDHPLRATIAEDKWGGELHVFKIPIRNGKEIEETVSLEGVSAWM